MRTIVVGLGVQGHKRAAIAGDDLVGVVDPIHPKAQYKDVRDVPLASYDSALVCTPDQVKFELLRYLLANGKHCLVEKPLLTADNAQIQELASLAKENRATCYTAYNHRFEPHLMALKQIIESGQLGKIYSARFFYGNGTARDVKLSQWRDKGMGVLPDLGSHMLDMALYLFGEGAISRDFEPWNFNKFENAAYDHVLFGAQGAPNLIFEATLLSWRNTFTADVLAEKGSAHIHCLCKWGPSALTVRTRILPSGRPKEEVKVIESADPTWAAEYSYFKDLCHSGESNLENDLKINVALNTFTDS